jgi:nucleoside-diphosphate kinase
LPERTFTFFKPETIMRGFIGEVLSRFERKGFVVNAMKLLWVTEEQAKILYDAHKAKPFFRELIEHTTSGPIVALVVEGPDAIKVVRKLVGATNPALAEPGTIRGDYSLEIFCNTIHASDSPENAEREMNIFFRKDEIYSYVKPTERQFLFMESWK